MVNVLHIRLEAYAKEISITSESQNGFRNSILDYVLTLQTVFIRNPYEKKKNKLCSAFIGHFHFKYLGIFFSRKVSLAKAKKQAQKAKNSVIKKIRQFNIPGVVSLTYFIKLKFQCYCMGVKFGVLNK